MFNRMAAEGSAKNEVLNRVLRLQLEVLKAEVDGYLSGDPLGREGMEKSMPHEWGSLDSFDDMRNSCDTALALLNRMQGAMLGEDPGEILAELQRDFSEVFFPCSTAEGVAEALGVEVED